MFLDPKRSEIDHHTSKLIVGVIAISLASIANLLSGGELQSISESYYMGDWPRNIFVGCLFVISAFLFSYNGISKTQMILGKMAAFAGLGVALFPCKCGTEVTPYVHYVSATVMFAILSAFCFIFYKRAMNKGHMEARIRAGVYAVCGIGIVASILILAIDHFSGGSISSTIPRLTFYGERTVLISFGIAWLIASRHIMFITREDERIALFSNQAKGS